MTKKNYSKPESTILEIKIGEMLAGVSGNKTDPIDGGDSELAKPVSWDDFEDDYRNPME